VGKALAPEASVDGVAASTATMHVATSADTARDSRPTIVCNTLLPFVPALQGAARVRLAPMTLAVGDVFGEIADGASRESSLWAEALLPPAQRDPVPVFSALVAEERFALGVETIYEGYLLHYGRSRLFAPADDDVALLLGDALLAHGLVRIAATGSVAAVADLAELLSLCAQARADGLDGDGAAWAATAALLARGGLDEARAALRDDRDSAPLERLARTSAGDSLVDAALAAHAGRLR
jgi:hypothetical protein